MREKGIMLPEVKALIDQLGLKPLPVEGTLYAETYRSSGGYEDGKPCGTAMLGLYCDEPREPLPLSPVDGG